MLKNISDTPAEKNGHGGQYPTGVFQVIFVNPLDDALLPGPAEKETEQGGEKPRGGADANQPSPELKRFAVGSWLSNYLENTGDKK